MTDAPSTQKSRRGYQKHGLYTLQRRLKEVGLKAIDGRSITGRALAQWRADLVRDLGGDDAVSTQQGALIDLCVKSKLLLDSIDVWLLGQPSLINKRKKSLLPIARERQQLADGLAKFLSMLGLERRVKVKTLADLLAEDDDDGKARQDAPVPANGDGRVEGTA